MKIVVDREKCISTGNCENLAPHVFEINDDGELEVDEDASVPLEDLEAVTSAVSGCPVGALSLIDEGHP